jgi:hypothetical protein
MLSDTLPFLAAEGHLHRQRILKQDGAHMVNLPFYTLLALTVFESNRSHRYPPNIKLTVFLFYRIYTYANFCLYRAQGKLDKAEQMFRRVRACRE